MFHYVVHSLQPLAYLNKTDPSGTPYKQIFVNTLKVTPICYIINFLNLSFIFWETTQPEFYQ